MNDYHKELAEKAERLRALVLGVATELAKQTGKPWTPKTSEDDGTRGSSEIVNGNGATLHLGFERNHVFPDRDRVTVSGNLNVGKHGQWVTVYENGHRLSSPSITVAFARGHEVIAKEIARRVLPEYLRVLELAKVQLQRENDYRTNVQNRLRTLAAITHDHLDFEKEPERSAYSFYESEGPSGTVQALSDSIDLKFHCSMKEAEYILRYLYRDKKQSV